MKNEESLRGQKWQCISNLVKRYQNFLFFNIFEPFVSAFFLFDQNTFFLRNGYKQFENQSKNLCIIILGKNIISFIANTLLYNYYWKIFHLQIYFFKSHYEMSFYPIFKMLPLKSLEKELFKKYIYIKKKGSLKGQKIILIKNWV